MYNSKPFGGAVSALQERVVVVHEVRATGAAPAASLAVPGEAHRAGTHLAEPLHDRGLAELVRVFGVVELLLVEVLRVTIVHHHVIQRLILVFTFRVGVRLLCRRPSGGLGSVMAHPAKSSSARAMRSGISA